MKTGKCNGPQTRSLGLANKGGFEPTLCANMRDREPTFGSWPNGIKLVVTYYHIKGYGNSCRVHSRAVWTGACSIPCCHASVHDSDQLPQLLVRDS
jgi:hypothetical protein